MFISLQLRLILFSPLLDFVNCVHMIKTQCIGSNRGDVRLFILYCYFIVSLTYVTLLLEVGNPNFCDTANTLAGGFIWAA